MIPLKNRPMPSQVVCFQLKPVSIPRRLKTGDQSTVPMTAVIKPVKAVNRARKIVSEYLKKALTSSHQDLTLAQASRSHCIFMFPFIVRVDIKHKERD